jgi:hypothetical protein
MPMLRQPRGTYTYGKPRSKTGRRIMLWWHHIVARYLVQQVTGWTAGATSFVAAASALRVQHPLRKEDMPKRLLIGVVSALSLAAFGLPGDGVWPYGVGSSRQWPPQMRASRKQLYCLQPDRQRLHRSR